MGLYKYVRDAWKNPRESMPELWKERLIAWRSGNSTTRIEHPTRIDRARSLGYKAKQGFIIIRQRLLRGGHRRQDIAGGRRPKHFGKRLTLVKNYQHIAEERVQKKFVNLSVLNSYWVAEDGKHVWYEVIMVDPDHPVIKADPSINWIFQARNRTRVFHGRTSAGRKSRGAR